MTTILILGAGGLIGEGLARTLSARGHRVVAAARRLSPSQRAGLPDTRILPLVDLDPQALAVLMAETGAEVVVNAIGVLQDAPGTRAADVHAGFVSRLLEALEGRPVLLVHLSVPGDPAADETGFSRTKREAERRIEVAAIPHAILRPGFVVAPAAFGGSALLRALAALPVRLPQALAARPFAVARLHDIAATVERLAQRFCAGEQDMRLALDIMEAEPSTVGAVVEGFRRRFGGPPARVTLPEPLLALGSRMGDVAATLGWRPPVRSTALAEMRRGVRGDAQSWSAETGLAVPSLATVLRELDSSVQERWFARLFLLKGVVFATLALFWIVSGLVALGPSFAAARALLVEGGMAPGPAGWLTVATALLDVAVGILIALRRTARAGLWLGLLVGAGYLLASAVVTPALWLDPVGSLVKTVPALVLMLAALAVLDERG